MTTFADMPITVINIRLEIKGAPGDALMVVDTMLDNGDPQDRINDHEHGDAGPLHVVDARVTEGDHEERLRALADVVDLIRPPGGTDGGVLRAIAERLAEELKRRAT